MICVICAMSEERDAFLSLMKDVETIEGKFFMYHGTPLDTRFYKGKIDDQDVAIIHSGVGKVYAAIITSEAINEFHPKLIINVGVAGSVDKDVHVGDVVVGDRVADWDVDVPGWERSIYSSKVSYECDSKFIKLAKKNKNIKIGSIVSADEFIYKKSQVNTIKKYFPSALCGEMEGGSIACTCYAYGVKCAIVRSISDEALVNGSYKKFDFNLNDACKNAAKICCSIIKKYEKVVQRNLF